MSKAFQKFVIIYLVAALISVSFLGGLWLGDKSKPDVGLGKLVAVPGVGEKPFYLSQNVDFKLFEEVWQTVRDNYIDRDKVLDSEMFYGALRGLVASLGDPHSVFFDPKETADFSNELSGSFEGIGIEISIKKDQLVVVSPLPGTPAYQAGLQSNDKILAIDDKLTASLTLYEAVNLIRGPKGTKVKLLISRDDWAEPQIMEIARDEIHFDSVKWELKPDNIFYIEVVSFNNDTLDLFNQAVLEVLKTNPKGIVLDLRSNPGGYLDQAVEIASEWIEDGTVVIEDYGNQKQEKLGATGRARLKDFPTIVLVNGGSASSSEILSGALQDYKKVTLVGTKTFGKGSVQELERLSNNSSLKITIARWLTPLGRQIDKVGIAPNLWIDKTKEDFDNDKDPQLDKAVELLLGKDWLVTTVEDKSDDNKDVEAALPEVKK